MPSDETDAVWDVAVIGCGPVGAMAAHLLARHGLRTIVLEREATPYPLPRAVHLDHEMMRLFADAGVLADVEPLMVATDGHVHIGADGGVIRYMGTSGRSTPFAFANDYFFYQPELEQALRDRLTQLEAVTLLLGCDVVSLAQDDDHVTLSVRSEGAVRRIKARYAIGCDGARSAVRKALAIPLDDLNFEEPWLVVDAEVDGALRFPDFAGVPPEAQLERLSVMLCDPQRPTTVVPGRGNHRRWEFMLMPGESDAEMMEPARVAALLEPWVAGVPHRIVRAATYRFHGLVAQAWRCDRIFLAGDAAHQTPPFFGQGMCHGFRDVANLAWKLKLVLDGTAAPALLATYQAEREPHVRAVIGAAVEAGRYICELDPVRARLRDQRMRDAMMPDRQITAADLIPAIDRGIVGGAPGHGDGARFIQPIVADLAGRRSRLDAVTGGGWHLLHRAGLAPALDGEAEAVWRRLGGSRFEIGRDLLDVEGHLIEWLDARQADWVIVRPDFYTFAARPFSIGASAAIAALGEAMMFQTDLQGAC